MDAIEQVEKERQKLMKELPSLKEILRSTISRNYMTCGYKKCRCHKGEKHGPFVYLGTKVKGKLKMYFVPKELEKEVREGVKRYNILWEKIYRLCDLNREILWLKRTAKE